MRAIKKITTPFVRAESDKAIMAMDREILNA